MRVLVGSGLGRQALARSSIALPIVEGGLAASVVPPASDRNGSAPDSPCWRFEIDPAKAIGGAAVPPQALVEAWERGLRDAAAPHRWLLEPVRGADEFAVGLAPHVEGLQTEDGALLLCTSGPAPDLPSRLAHPALWFPQPVPEDGALEGPGPFRREDSGALQPARDLDGGPPYLERVEPVDDRGEPALLLRLREADLGVVLGLDAGELLDPPDERLRLERVERWDRVYYFWLDSGRRWVNDPRFRRWLGSVLDRRAMLEFLFAGQGEPAAALLAADALDPSPPAPTGRPLSPDSRPRIDLCFDAGDPIAVSIAARARAVLELHRVELVLEPLDAAALSEALSRGRASMVLLAHRPALGDPVLALIESLAPLPGVPAATLQALRAGSRLAAPGERELAARGAEKTLLEDGRLVPLLRLHAWLAADPALRGVRAGEDGLLFLDRAWWAR